VPSRQTGRLVILRSPVTAFVSGPAKAARGHFVASSASGNPGDNEGHGPL